MAADEDSRAGDDQTPALLQRWHAGDRTALRQLLQRDLPWIRQRVRQRLGDELRRHGDTDDFLQQSILEILEYTPRFTVPDGDTFRRLISQIVENMLRERHAFYGRLRRDRARQEPLPSDSVLCLDPRLRTATTPSQNASRNEEEAWLRLALELLAPEDRDVITLRTWGGLTFAQVGERLGLEDNAARMRFGRALQHLADKVLSLRRGEI